MSGFEVVGVILGVLPLVLKAGKELYLGGGLLKDWWRYEQTFNDFINDIDYEYYRLEALVRTLLNPLPIPDDRIELLLQANGECWMDSTLQQELRERLGDNYIRFMQTLEDLKFVVFEMIEILPIEDGKVNMVNKSKLRRELDRIHHVLSRRKPELLSQMKKNNDRLKEILEIGVIRSAYSRNPNVSNKTIATSRKLKALAARRNQVKALHGALERSLQCDHTHSHRLGISLQSIQGTKNDLDSIAHKLLLRESPPMICKAQTHSTEDTPATETKSPSFANNILEIKQQNMMKKATGAKSYKTIKKGLGSIFKVVNLKVRASEEPNIQGIPNPKHRVDKGVRFQPPQRRCSISLSRYPLIKDLCASIHSNSAEPFAGYFSMEAQTSLILSQEKDDLTPHETLSLAEVMSGELPPKSQRFQLAHLLVSSLPELQGTNSWIGGRWSLEHILIKKQTEFGTINTNGGFFIREYLHQQHGAQTTKFLGTKQSLFCLGVVLLELSFGQKLESHPLRRMFLDNGRPNDFTDLCTAKKWQEKVEEEFGYDLAEAIRHCIDSDLGPTPDFDDDEFLDCVITYVVEPVQTFASLWVR
ncbi:uncharacterized protein LDX57_002635 [Aspergillus melleus]|uniref:uncharacterized protein n=1 Tax=Aspergillus melleus TaxID=138277 RepID=UPI001E8EA6C6|nr:uncharacterized protein LDX57_002635 [Aspergillus melleus]KAH8424890.1 hypothetical protein LDX57_002635 [Aspergillus melleus]